ncbi:MAG TPA: bifunctional phosphopantothenoylcysteine decarboxylase/phosphopantothenate--cysteine ligase CoaBC [Thermoplasmatales archaeon]|nr:bifunctional phosphopantothenoylcysteine decarboxylase/phosphopantothenate--cysteine ligase CoaBC [Thermoplasmatales archaeon]
MSLPPYNFFNGRAFKNVHPSEVIKGSVSKKLEGKKIILGITGSIACVECVKIARELIRHGADVVALMSEEACKILGYQAMEFATGKKVITEISGNVEHVSIEGDLLLIAPCTANTISKIALGIADNVITSFAIAFTKKILIVPSMHLSMYKNEFLQENIEKCRKKGVKFILPKIEEGKAKMAGIENIVEDVIRILKGGKEDKKVLIIGGATHEPIDDVRVITNLSSGKMAKALAKEAYERGAEVTLWASFEPYDFIENKKFSSIKNLINMIEESEKKYDVAINCSAISDFVIDKKRGKIKSGKEVNLKLKPAPRINPMLKKIAKIVIAFKLEEKEEEVSTKAYEMIEKDGVDYAIGNTVESIGKEYTKIWIFGKEGLIKKMEGKKEEVAEYIIDLI